MIQPNTHYPVSPQDDTEYFIVGNRSTQLRPNFRESEFYNAKTGLSEHPIARACVDAVQFLRTQSGIPIRITSTYRNYIPAGGVNPATISPHMLAQGIDFQFIADSSTADQLYLEIREDFNNQGPLFQALWEIGIRGFGSYDHFIHLDCVTSELYQPFRQKRWRTYRGQIFGRWDNMKRLRYRSPGSSNLLGELVLGAAGSVQGWINELRNNEDQGRDAGFRNVLPIILIIAATAALGYFGYRYYQNLWI